MNIHNDGKDMIDGHSIVREAWKEDQSERNGQT